MRLRGAETFPRALLGPGGRPVPHFRVLALSLRRNGWDLFSVRDLPRQSLRPPPLRALRPPDGSCLASARVADALVSVLQLETLKTQHMTTAGSDHSSKVLLRTAAAMWANGGVRRYYRGLTVHSSYLLLRQEVLAHEPALLSSASLASSPTPPST